ncbi:MAG: hypothetical protein NC206_08370 [Bacteroides sp.]|nr:hypothetical protein [Roseburia sp.]MCM1347083.1 hypothetical protein [Bacteroides sp.]
MAKKKRFYILQQNCYFKGVCCLIPTKKVKEFMYDGKEAKGFENMTVTLPNDGKSIYLPMHSCPGACEVVSKEFKELVEKYIPEGYPIEFIPVRAVSEVYGERQYYFMHFLKYEDAIILDKSKVIYHEEDGSYTVCVPVIDASKVRNLHIFKIKSVCGLTISGELRLALIKNNLKTSLMVNDKRFFIDPEDPENPDKVNG